MNKKNITRIIWILLLLTILDTLNVPSILTNQIQGIFDESNLASLVIILLVFLILLYFQWFGTVWTQVVQIFNEYLTLAIFPIIVYALINTMPGFELTAFKGQLLCITSIMLLCMMFLLYIRKQFSNLEVNGNNLQTVFDLNDLSDETEFINWNPEQCILLKETTDTIDLLNRNSTIVADLTRTISNCHYREGGFVIALTGSWGNGKTTVINMVANQLEELVVVNDFTFWEYVNKEALLKGVIERIMEETDSVLSLLERQAFIQSVLEIVSDKSGFNLQRLFLNDINQNELKKKIAAYLIEKNKRILFVIDDLERTNSSIAVLIFKVIATVLDIGNVIYLVSYDEVEMQKHFSVEGIEFNYIDKIINQKFTLPKISESKLTDETKKAMTRLTQIYRKNDDLVSIIEEVAELLPVENIRDIKRMLNSLMPYIQKNELGLNERDRLLINYIKFKDYALWEKLSNGKKYISDRYYVNSKDCIDMHDSTYKKRESAYIEDITKNYSQYRSILNTLFNRFQSINITEDQKNENYNKVSISSYGHFDVFFEEGHGIHTKIVTKIKADLANSEEIDKKYIEWLKFESNNLEIVFRYLIHSQCGEYSKNNYNVSKAIINNVNLLQEESIYLAAEYIVCILANKRNHEYGAVKKLLFERMENYPEDYYFYKWIEGSLFSEKQDRDLGIAGDIKDTFIRLLSQIENEMIANFHIKVSNRNINRMLWNFIDFEYNAEKIFQSIEKEKIIQWFQQQFSIHSALEYLQVATEYTHANTFRKNEYQIYNDFIQRLQLTKQLRSVDVSLLEQKDLINSKNVLRMYEQWLSENS